MIAKQRGMALAVVLVLLLGMSIIAVAGLSGAVADLALAALDEQAALALQAAEAGVLRTLRSGMPIPAGTPPWPALFPDVTLYSELEFDPLDAGSMSPEEASALAVRHFTIRAEGRAGRGAVARIEQGFRVIGPADDDGSIACAGEGCPAGPAVPVTAPDIAPEIRTDPVRTSWRQLDTTVE